MRHYSSLLPLHSLYSIYLTQSLLVQGEAGPRVFLLSLRMGSAGLTLTRANHVFLLEPSMDPAVEQQVRAGLCWGG